MQGNLWCDTFPGGKPAMALLFKLIAQLPAQRHE